MFGSSIAVSMRFVITSLGERSLECTLATTMSSASSFVGGDPGRDDVSCADQGVLGALTGVLGSLAAIEAVRALVGPGSTVAMVGPSGVGKAETARVLSDLLAPGQPLPKINFGNYSSKDSLNSLIGSPRGYIGSEEGELSLKIEASESGVILIDEFEKANPAVWNFFLDLLESGHFTDPQGAMHDLDGYTIVFTSNAPKEEVRGKFPPELLSRFGLKTRFAPPLRFAVAFSIDLQGKHGRPKANHDVRDQDGLQGMLLGVIFRLVAVANLVAERVASRERIVHLSRQNNVDDVINRASDGVHAVVSEHHHQEHAVPRAQPPQLVLVYAQRP